MDIKEYSGNSLSFIGDAVFTLAVREYFVSHHYQSSASLQKLCIFREEELEAYKRGRNHISHIPKNGDLSTYECASGLEAICGYLYLTDKERLKLFFEKVFEGGVHNE